MSGQGTRSCGFCHDGVMHASGEQGLRGGGREVTWTCADCGSSVKLVSPAGRFTLGLMTAFMIGAVPWVAVTDRVARESQRPWIVLIVATFAVCLGALLLRDGGRQKRHPPRA